MAITPRTILTSAAPATIAVISLYVFTALGTMAYKAGRDASHDHDFNHSKRVVNTIVISSGDNPICSEVLDALGTDKRAWTESNWITYAACFDYQKESSRVISVASQGLRYYPQSETLYNLVGYHQIVTGQHEEAVKTLRRGMNNASSQNGIMANNLAWAGLWTPRSMPLDEARVLYRQSLALNPGSCETIHTGLWVEYATARNTNSIERVQALSNFQQLRQMYAPCMSRVHQADKNTLAEIVGASVIFDDIDQQQRGTSRVSTAAMHATKQLVVNHSSTSVDEFCAEAMPLAETHHKCVSLMQENVQRLEQHQRALRQHQAKRTHCGGITR